MDWLTTECNATGCASGRRASDRSRYQRLVVAMKNHKHGDQARGDDVAEDAARTIAHQRADPKRSGPSSGSSGSPTTDGNHHSAAPREPSSTSTEGRTSSKVHGFARRGRARYRLLASRRHPARQLGGGSLGDPAGEGTGLKAHLIDTEAAERFINKKGSPKLPFVRDQTFVSPAPCVSLSLVVRQRPH